MKGSQRVTKCSTVVLASSLLIGLAGCLSGSAYYVAAEHDAPEHKPADFPSAVARIAELWREQFGWGHPVEAERATPRGELDADKADAAWVELSELAGWLSELAIDSDLDEANWTVADQTGAAMLAWLEQHQQAADRSQAVAAAQEIWQQWMTDLQRVVDAYQELLVASQGDED